MISDTGESPPGLLTGTPLPWYRKQWAMPISPPQWDTGTWQENYGPCPENRLGPSQSPGRRLADAPKKRMTRGPIADPWVNQLPMGLPTAGLQSVENP